MLISDTTLDRICIVMLSAIGDVVHTLPVVSAIKRARPASHISWVLQPGPAGLVSGHPLVDEIILFRRKSGLAAFREARRVLSERRFDIVLAMQSYFKAGLLTSFARAPIKLGFDRQRSRDLSWLFTTRRLPARGERHFQDQYLEFAEALGVSAEPLEWQLGPYPSELPWRTQFAARFDRPIAVLVIGTSKPEKDWPAERWGMLCRSLYDVHGLAPVVVGGLSEREQSTLKVIQDTAGVPVASTLGASLRELVSILDASALVVSPDTGPMHIAVALGRPTIALMGYTNPKRVGPYRRFQDLLVDAYGEAGEHYPVSRATRPGRMQRITVEDVEEKLAVWEAVYRTR